MFKRFIQSILLGLTITLLTCVYWFFKEYWFHYLGLIGYVIIGWIVAEYYNKEDKIIGGGFISNFKEEKTFYNNQKLTSIMFNLNEDCYKTPAEDLIKYKL